ncbi:aminotransferases class-i pyridoxal-phosphate attachment site [Lucifera butyrica]|uniref:Aminotransferase n=1 Tax=Lucifera butyrica TaxID=1351585 RepID=A0A498R5A9_9FIRM|nr:aminotransferase class I/II-fold pyridoxal phosphate-dependent enzyme [Lucifera butyrica]VBB07906.1 aminotransferases class-i pyridoxal-phosphate attachment site [Lucifera butyrica]
MFNPARRMQGLTSAIFSEVDELRKKEVAAGNDVITLSIGSPDMAPAAHIIEALKNAVIEPHSYGYTLSKGTPRFLAAVAEWYGKNYNVKLDPETEIHSLMGSQDGLAHIALCFANPGDVVLVPDPGYPIFSAGPSIAGAELYRMPLTAANHYLPDLDSLPENVLRRTKLMIINYPNNPLAATATPEFYQRVVALAHEYQFLVCSDFAYSELVFDGYKPESFLSIPGAREIGIEFNSLSKTYNMAGCRVAFVVGNSQAIAELGRLKSNFDYGIFYPVQQAAVAALTGPQDCVKATADTYRRRRDILVDGLNNAGWPVDRPRASMYIWAPVPAAQLSVDFTIDLLKNTGVAVIPGKAFGQCGEGFVRIALVQPEVRLKEAVHRIQTWFGKLNR